MPVSYDIYDPANADRFFNDFYAGSPGFVPREGNQSSSRDQIVEALMSQSRLDMPFQAQQPPPAPINVSPRPSRLNTLYDMFYAGSPGFQPGMGPGYGTNPPMVGDPGGGPDPYDVGRPVQDPGGPPPYLGRPVDDAPPPVQTQPNDDFIGPRLEDFLPRDPNVTNQGPTLGDSQQQGVMSNNPATSPIIQQGDSPYLLGNVPLGGRSPDADNVSGAYDPYFYQTPFDNTYSQPGGGVSRSDARRGL
jgi:hypothetical protein